MAVFLCLILLVSFASIYATSCVCQLSNKEYDDDDDDDDDDNDKNSMNV